MNKLSVIVGTPGTGKSYRLIKEVIQCEIHNKSYSVIVPTNVAKSRILNGFKKSLSNNEIKISQYYDLMMNVHVLQYNYHGEQNIFIDEFSMFSIDDFYSLLYKVLLVKDNVKITAYGDSKQLQPVRSISPLLILLRFNYDKFVDVDRMPFNQYSATKLYDNLQDMDLEVPDNWKLAIDKVNLKVLHKNFRLKEVDNVNDYNWLFYQYVLQNNLIDSNYESNLIGFAKQKYLIIVPTHDLGKDVDEILFNKLCKNDVLEAKKIAPFIRNQDKVYCNPYCELKYGFDNFVPRCEKDVDVKDFKFSFYVTSHATQGATVDNMVFYLGDKDIDKGQKNFYTNNMLYTALSRARYNSMFLGSEYAFLKMTNTFAETDLSILNTQLQEEALDLTYQAIVNSDNYTGIFTNNEIIKLYNHVFKKVVKTNNNRVKDISLVDPKFEIKPYSSRKILGVMKQDSETKLSKKYQNDLLRLGYGFHYAKYISNQRSKAGKIGGSVAGKTSQVQKWVDSLNIHEYNRLRDDCKTLSVRKFALKYGHKKEAVQKYVK